MKERNFFEWLGVTRDGNDRVAIVVWNGGTGMKGKLRKGAALLLTALLLTALLVAASSLPVAATGFSAANAAYSGAVRTTMSVDISDGWVRGVNNAYEFKVPNLWKECVLAEREMVGNPDYVVDRINFMVMPASRQSAPQLLMSLFVIDKTHWRDSLPYTPVVFSRDYVFAVVKGMTKTPFASSIDNARYKACDAEIATAEAVKSRIVLAPEQALWRSMAVFVNGKLVDNSVVLIGGVYYLPLRDVYEALGYTVSWSQATQSVTIRKAGGFYERLKISAGMLSDERGYKMRLIEGRTYVSTAYVYSVLRATIEFDDRKNVYVTVTE